MASFYTDEDVGRQTAMELGKYGHFTTTARDQRLESVPDPRQLLTAADNGWILVTHNRRDFVLLNDAWLRWQRAWNGNYRHAGILVIPQTWDPVEAAHKLDEFISTRPTLADELHSWNTVRGWEIQRLLH